MHVYQCINYWPIWFKLWKSGLIKCKRDIMAFYIVLCDSVVISPWMSSAACKLYVGHRSVVRSTVEHFNCKWPLYSVLSTVHENCLCWGGTQEHKTKPLDMARRIAYDLSLLMVPHCYWLFMIFDIILKYCRWYFHAQYIQLNLYSLVTKNCRLLFCL